MSRVVPWLCVGLAFVVGWAMGRGSADSLRPHVDASPPVPNQVASTDAADESPRIATVTHPPATIVRAEQSPFVPVNRPIILRRSGHSPTVYQSLNQLGCGDFPWLINAESSEELSNNGFHPVGWLNCFRSATHAAVSEVLKRPPEAWQDAFGPVASACWLAESFRLREAIPLLANHIDYIGGDFRDVEAFTELEYFSAARALGEIGGPAAAEACHRLYTEPLTPRQAELFAYVILRQHLEMWIEGPTWEYQLSMVPLDHPGRVAAQRYLKDHRPQYESGVRGIPDSQIADAIDFMTSYQFPVRKPPEFLAIFPEPVPATPPPPALPEE